MKPTIMSAIFIPKNNYFGNYLGGLEQPIDWKINRSVAIRWVDDHKIIATVKGTQLAPQDQDVLYLFAQTYGSSSWKLTYDGLAITLILDQTTINKQMIGEDLLELLTDAYEAVNARRIDYTQDMLSKYYKNTYVIEKQVNDVVAESLNVFVSEQYERAPDVYVRP